MHLDQLEALLGVLEHGSFLGAARALGRRRATLQSQVETLEAELGQRLLVRSSTGTQPTRAGQAFSERARRLLQDADALSRFLTDGPPASPLRIAMQPGLPPNLFVFVAQILGVRLADTPLTFRVISPDEALNDPDVDLICQFRDALPRGPYQTLVAHRYPIRLLASPRYLDARGRPSSIADLREHDLLAWTGHRPERAGLWPRTEGPEFPITPALVCNDTHVVRTLANAGQGIALVADAAQVQGTLTGEVLEPVLDGIVAEEGRARILIPDRSVQSPSVRAFIELAREFGLEKHVLPAT